MNKILLKLILHIWTRAFILKIQVDRCNDDFAFSQLLSSYRVSIFLALTKNIVISLKNAKQPRRKIFQSKIRTNQFIWYTVVRSYGLLWFKKNVLKFILNSCNVRNTSLFLEKLPFTGVLWMWDLFKYLWLCHLKGSVANLMLHGHGIF